MALGPWTLPATPRPPCSLVFPAGPDKEGPPRKKPGLGSLRLSSPKSRDQGVYTGCRVPWAPWLVK